MNINDKDTNIHDINDRNVKSLIPIFYVFDDYC